ncbi:MAG: DUF4886 domain-containing protein [Clostridia bacterium]|nr:DUF4886 domain-containing protein [Clostridia bacterium]
MNILSIGNSFSHDPHAYLHQIAASDGYDLTCINLFVGGNVLAHAYRNTLSDERIFEFEMNGDYVGFRISLKEALINRTWDVITLQQMSLDSVNYDSYQPYLNRLVDFIRLCAPKSKIAIQQTWAYRQDYPLLKSELGYSDRVEMYAALRDAYARAAEDIKPDFFIPSGELFEEMLASGVNEMYSDGMHASRGIGRYALGLLWYKVLTGRPIDSLTFMPIRETISESDIRTAKKCVNKVAERYSGKFKQI